MHARAECGVKANQRGDKRDLPVPSGVLPSTLERGSEASSDLGLGWPLWEDGLASWGEFERGESRRRGCLARLRRPSASDV